MKRELTVGKNWIAGSDETSLSKVEVRRDGLTFDVEYIYRFDEGGFFDDQSKPSPLKAIREKNSIAAEHGYMYIASKELFLYSEKTTDILRPQYPTIIPARVKVALDPYNEVSPPETISSGIPSGVPSGIPSGIGYTLYSLTDIPKHMTPIVVTEIGEGDENIEVPTTIRSEESLNDSREIELTVPTGRFAGFEESISEPYEVSTIKNLNNTDNNIINPELYIYDPFTNSVYVRGTYGNAALEYETSQDKQAKLDSNFTISKIGKLSGLLSIIDETERPGIKQVSSTRKRNINLRGTQLFINEEENVTLLVEVKTIYEDETGAEIEYQTIENNYQYAIITSDNHINDDIYIEGIRVGTFDSNGRAIVPILAYANNGIHSGFNVNGKARIDFHIAPILPISGRLRVLVIEPDTGETLDENIMIVQRSEPNVGVGKPVETIKYLDPNITSTSFSRAILITPITINPLHNSHRKESIPVEVTDIYLCHKTNVNLNVSFEPIPTASYLRFETIQFQIIPPEGGIPYGVG